MDLAKAEFIDGGDAGRGHLQHRHRPPGTSGLSGGCGGVRCRHRAPARLLAIARERASQARVLTFTQPRTGVCRKRAMTLTLATLAEDVIPHPTAPQTVEESGLSLDLILQLVLKTLHFAGELTGTELARRLGLKFLGHRAGDRAAQGTAPGRDRRRRHRRRRLVPLSHHRRRTHARRAVPREQPLRRRRAGAARAVSAVHGGVPGRGAAHRDARPRARGVLASRDQRPRARPARSGDQRRPFDVRLRPARKRQDRHLAGDSRRCSTATSPSRTRSKSRAASSASSIRSTTSRSTTTRTMHERDDARRRTIAAGCAAGGRW